MSWKNIVGAGLIFFVTATPVIAAGPNDTLGDTVTSTSAINFPPITAGTGYILPDSPLYPIDQAYQKAKLAVAFSPSQKAYVHTKILGERMAELRVMFERNNMSAINKTLNEVADEGRSAAAALAESSATGEKNEKMAKFINDILKEYRSVLAAVSEQSADELSLHVDSTNKSLLSSKVRVEESLSPTELAEAIQNDRDTETNSQVLGLSTASLKLQKNINMMEMKASKAAEQRQNALKGLDAKKLQKIKDFEQKKAQITEAYKQKLTKLKERLQNSQGASADFKDLQNLEKELRTLMASYSAQSL